ncbi:MAG: DNA polymerase III subunit alpha [Deltaproteobacteria bacterium]|nr:DNA polymerase III subunit alpha [Deltaproteobacteria bacterium]
MLTERSTSSLQFCELNVKSNYSFLEGGSHPEELIEQTHLLGYQGMALTDINGVYGASRAHLAAEKLGLNLIIGSEINISNSPMILLCQNRNGYGNLCELLTLIHQKKTPDIASFLFSNLLVIFPVTQEDNPLLPQLKEIFRDRLYLMASYFHDGSPSLMWAETFSQKYQLPVVASNRPLFHHPHRKPLQDVLTCIKHTEKLNTAGFKLLPNLERHLKSLHDLKQIFSHHPDWISQTIEVAERCHFSLKELHYRYPTEWLPAEETGDSYLRKLVFEGARERYPEGIPDRVQKQIQHELSLIRELSYSDYFLTIWDIVQFARSRNILYQGRGSAANSIVCFVLGITAIDPVRMDLLFERFISRERKEPPDIDIDFEHQRREEVIQFIYERYGRDRAAITATHICFRRKSALREVAKAFDFPLLTTERLLSLSHKRCLSEIPIEEFEAVAPDIPKRLLKQFFSIVSSILTFPRHLGTHVGGFVLSQDKLTRSIPIESAAMEGRTVVQWDKNDLDALGFTRVDILGLGILTCIRKSFEYLKSVYGKDYTLATLPAEDPKVYEAISRGDTIGVFQIESRAQMNMLPRLKPRTFFDLVVEISIVRPGPIQGEMVHPYLKRRQGLEKIQYPHPKLESILKKTYGVPIFQEQIMKMAMEVAGFTGGEADTLRRAMGTWRRDQKTLSEIALRFKEGLVNNGLSEDYAAQVFKQIEGFAEYGFPESHAASFALLAYATAFLKFYYPDVYLTALLNSQPMGFYQSHTLIHDAQRHGVKTLPIDVSFSRYDNTLEAPNQMRLGFREIQSLQKKTGEAIERLNKPFKNFEDFLQKLQEKLLPNVLTKRELFHLASSDAFNSLGLARREALWKIQALQLQDSPLLWSEKDQTILPEEENWERIALDYDTFGVSLFCHPMDFLRKEFKLKNVTSFKELSQKPHGSQVTVAGLVVSRQMPPTANGVLFITLEDEFGFMNLVVWNSVYQQFKDTLFKSSFLMCEGKIQKAKGAKVTHVIVDKAFPLLPISTNETSIKVHTYQKIQKSFSVDSTDA